jgi:hypothetical protein
LHEHDRYLGIKKLATLLLVLLPAWVMAQTATLDGTITDSNGEPLIGATVLLEGTTMGSITDFDGKYEVANIPVGTYNVVYSFVGYKRTTETVTLTKGQRITVNKMLEEDATILEEAVVIGYGTTQTKDLTGSVVAIDTKDFQKGNFATPEQLVTGKIAGVQITSNSGAPGSGSRIRIRGW